MKALLTRKSTTRRPIRMGMLLIVFLLVVACDIGYCDGLSHLYLIGSVPNGDLPGAKPFPFVIYELGSSGRLDSVFSLPVDTRVEDVRIYPSVGTILISEGYPPPNAVDIISIRQLSVLRHYDLSKYGATIRIRQFETAEPYGQLTITSGTDLLKSTQKIEIRRVSPLRAPDVTASEDQSVGELRLAGASPVYGSGEHDIVKFKKVTVFPPETSDTGIIMMDAFPVTDSVIRSKNSPFWSMIAQEPGFLALLSHAMARDSQKEVLLYDRGGRQWASVLVPGSETGLRPLNGWLVGEVVIGPSENDSVKRWAGEGEATGQSVILDPLTRKLLVTQLEANRSGWGSEVIWIDQDTVYYRADDGLYRSRIGVDDLLDRTLILKDLRVRQVHWAFYRDEPSGVR